ncbi:MAG: TGS domain-containing protein [Planctomycetes bacterium]|nr:TGS domain-containing protein [Planctomycetota bacterium]
MPANLTPQFIKARAEFQKAITPEEKLECLNNMMALIPKHKGTDKLQGEIRRRIAEVKRDLTAPKKASKRSHGYKIPREGGAQLVVLGPPNAGKSQLLTHLTRAQTDVAVYPFTTHKPIPGMMKFEDIQFQLVDMPPITKDYMEPWMIDVVRAADAAILMLDLTSDDLLDHADVIKGRLDKVRIHLVAKETEETEETEEEELRLTAATFLPTMVLCNKIDCPGADQRLEIVREFYADHKVLPVSALHGTGLGTFGREVFDFVRVLRVYTKEPGKKADMEQPYVLPIGATVLDAAEMVHQDFRKNLKYARIWGTGVHDGQSVKRDHVLHDRDVIELHI